MSVYATRCFTSPRWLNGIPCAEAGDHASAARPSTSMPLIMSVLVLVRDFRSRTRHQDLSPIERHKRAVIHASLADPIERNARANAQRSFAANGTCHRRGLREPARPVGRLVAKDLPPVHVPA